jgi:hypothetical protein
MSIQLRVHFFKDGVEVHQSRTPGGYTYIDRTKQQLIDQVLEGIEFDIEWLKKYKPTFVFPEWDMFRIKVGDEVIEYRKP